MPLSIKVMLNVSGLLFIHSFSCCGLGSSFERSSASESTCVPSLDSPRASSPALSPAASSPRSPPRSPPRPPRSEERVTPAARRAPSGSTLQAAYLPHRSLRSLNSSNRTRANSSVERGAHRRVPCNERCL